MNVVEIDIGDCETTLYLQTEELDSHIKYKVWEVDIRGTHCKGSGCSGRSTG
jgi:hypothetical protein